MNSNVNNKEQMLTLLREELNRWEDLLASLSDKQITDLPLPNGWLIKDLMAHLMAWQQVTIARLEAAQSGGEPTLPEWITGTNPESDGALHRFNAKIYDLYQEQPWSQIHRSWKTGFLEVLRLSEEIPEADLLATNKYPWLKGYSLIAVLQNDMYEHHHKDHLEPLLTWLQK